jgi:hypothetical protein
MRIPVIRGLIKRRLLVNFRADPEVVQRIVPKPFTPKLHAGYAIVGVCLIRLEKIRPAGLPEIIGLSSENAAHRIAVQWKDEQGTEKEGVFIPRRDTGALLNRLAGGRLFPGEHHAARFQITEHERHIDFAMESEDGKVRVKVVGDETESLPSSSYFRSLAEASSFFEGGSLGYSVTRHGNRMDGLLLRTQGWRVHSLAVTSVHSSFFSDPERFPEGSIEFDHGLIMRDVAHEWHQADDLYALPPASFEDR